MTPEIFILNEGTLIPFLWRAVTRRSPYFLGIDPALPPLTRLLERVARWSLSANRARLATDLCPELANLQGEPNLTSLRDVFAVIEPWQDRYFRFDVADRDPAYGMAFKQVTCKYAQDRYIQTLILEAVLERRGGAGAVRLWGQRADSTSLLKAWKGGESDADAVPRAGAIIEMTLNAVLGLGVTLYALVWIALRIRPRVTPPPVFLAADFLMDPRDNRLYAEAERGGPVLLVKRTPDMALDTVPPEAGYQACTWADGRFGPIQALRAIATVVGDAFGMFGRYRWAAPAHYYALATLPYKRIVVRALLNRYRPRYFWGRDEYNVEHILRRQELNAVGGESLGLMHGAQGFADLNPRRRYISFDVFYMFGLHLYKKHYQRTWAEDMKVRAVGSFGLPREQFLSPRPVNPQIIAFFGNFCILLPEFAETVRKTAIAFPGYQVLVKPKKAFPAGVIESFAAKIRAGIDNVNLSYEEAADLTYSARYVLSEASTIITEAIHLGVPTLMLDMLPDHRQCLYRDFPGLCVSTADEAVARLRSWENGRETFDRSLYSDLVNSQRQWAFDIVCEDMGLSPKDAFTITPAA